MDLMSKDYTKTYQSIAQLLETARLAAARSVNALMTGTYWQIGRHIVEFEQGGLARAGYGDTLIERLSVDLSARFGRGFSVRNLEQMRLFYQAWAIPQTPSAESQDALGRAWAMVPDRGDLPALGHGFPLPWSAYVRLLAVKNAAARSFYETEALRGGWSVRQLSRQINSQFYERTLLSRNKVALLEGGQQASLGDAITPEEAIKDPFVLEFLNLKDQYSESDLEEALIEHLADFLLELGDDFAFVGRQRRLRIGDAWFRIDLLFFHRRLKSLLIIDLKIGAFSYTDAGQMHLYLNYAREHWTKAGENPPVGLILCASKDNAEAHYALENLPNKVLAAEYQTVLPKEKLLIHELERSRRALEAKQLNT